MAKVNLALLSRKEVEALLYATTTTLRQVVSAVKEHTKPEWKVAKEVDKLLSRYNAEVEPHVDRAVVERLAERRAERNAQRWEGFTDGNGRDRAPK